MKNKNKEYPMFRGLLEYFPSALREVSNCSFVANKQHNGDADLVWDRSKSNDHADAMLRHLIHTDTFDDDSVRHLTKVCWRGLALLQVALEKEGYPKSTNAINFEE